MEFIGAYEDKEDIVQKYVFRGKQGTIEISKINTKPDRDIFCIPSMYQCHLGCTFCHLTTNNIRGNSGCVEANTILKLLDRVPKTRSNRQLSIMGVGDPALNQTLVHDLAMTERVSIASIFPTRLNKFPKNVKIHFSLHSPFPNKRKKIVPAGALSIEECFNYLDGHEGDKEIHYTLIKDKNDSDLELFELCSLSKKHCIPIKFLVFNETGGLKQSERLDYWFDFIRSEGITVEIYMSPGRSIGSSCGAFSKYFYNDKGFQSKEFKEFDKQYRLF